jgi:hypothetical protein
VDIWWQRPLGLVAFVAQARSVAGESEETVVLVEKEASCSKKVSSNVVFQVSFSKYLTRQLSFVFD